MALFSFSDVKVLVKPPNMFPEENISTDVPIADSPSSQPQGEADSSTATVEASADSQASVTGAEVSQPSVQDDPLRDIPDLETLKQQAEQKIPGAAGMLSLRSAYEAHKTETEPLMAWKDVVTQFNDPQEVISQRDLIGKIHSPLPDGQSGFTTLPFLNDLEAQSPGTVHKLAMDSLGLQVELNGQADSLIRHLFRGWGLDPDRLQDYKEIDTRAPAGVITPDQLVGIDQKYHAAFKALSPAQRDDILLQRDRETGEFPAAVMDYLQDKTEALEARSWREQDNQRKQQEAQAKQQEFEQGTVKAVDEDISTVRREMYDAIHQSLAQQWKPSSDETQNEFEYAKVLGILPALFYPEFQFIAENTLKQAGVTLNGKFAETANALMGAREAYVRRTREGDQMRARQSLSQANLAKAQLRTQLDQFALALAKPSAERLQKQSQQTISNLQGATARVVPSGTVQPASSGENPYMDNPHPFGSPEYLAYNKRLDKELGVGGAAAFAR